MPVCAAAVLLAALLLPAPSSAQPLGIAIVQAPEAGIGVAMARAPDAGFAAATQRCIEAGGMDEDCLPQAWCQPAGWTLDLFLQHLEGPHWHEFHCGLSDRETALALVAPLCDPARRPYLIECAAVQLHDPDGRPTMK